jgi:hypothetical protein
MPEIYASCDRERIISTIGLVPNTRLAHLAAPLLAEVSAQHAAPDGATVRRIEEITDQAGSSLVARREIVKAEALVTGPNTRFVVTTRPDPPEALYAWYTDRDETGNGIKDLTVACVADRLSCHRFLGLLLHGAAYCLQATLRRWLVAAGADRMQVVTLRLCLIKIGGRVRQLATRVHLRLASHHPGEPLWYRLATQEGPS